MRKIFLILQLSRSGYDDASGFSRSTVQQETKKASFVNFQSQSLQHELQKNGKL